MSKLLESVRAKAQSADKHIVLAEGEEKRIIDAAVAIRKEMYALSTRRTWIFCRMPNYCTSCERQRA